MVQSDFKFSLDIVDDNLSFFFTNVYTSQVHSTTCVERTERCCGQKRCEKGKLRKPSASKNQTKEDELLAEAESLGNENGISYRFAMLRLLMLVGICIPY